MDIYKEDNSTVFLNSIWVESLYQEILLYALIKSGICHRLRNKSVHVLCEHSWSILNMKKKLSSFIFKKLCCDSYDRKH